MAGIPGSLVAAGFDAAVLEELPQASRDRLARVAMLRRLAFLAIASAAGFAAHVSMHGGWPGFAAGALVAAVAWLLLSGMGRLLVSAGGPGAARGAAAAAAWRPGVLWPAFMLVAGLLAAQPMLLALGWGASGRSLDAYIDDRVAVNLARQRDILLAGDNNLRLQRAQLAERLATGGAPPAAGTNRRKALVIGVQEYRRAGRLNNPAKDARELAAKFRAMGFDVSLSVDEPGDALQLRIARHVQSLAPGDISVVVYSGHGYQRDGHNYMVPVDFDGRQVGGIRVTRMLEAIDRRSPQLQVIMLDACRSFESEGFRASTGGLAELQGGTNSFIAMAAQPGKEALDGPPGTNGLFTEAILRHIDRPEDINVLFRRISADVTAAARGRDFKQEPVVTSTLQSEYVQLVDPSIATPQALLGGDAAGAASVAAAREPAVCPTPPGLAPEQQQALVRACLRGRIDAIDRMLADWRAVGPETLRQNADAYRRSLRTSGLLSERLADMWSAAPVPLALMTLLVALAIASAELLNWRHRSELADYFGRRNHRAIGMLEQSHLRAEDAVQRRLATVRHRSYLELEPFRTPFDWKGPIEQPPSWAGDAPSPTRPQRSAIDAWLKAAGLRAGEVR
jgi:hypothetical protein